MTGEVLIIGAVLTVAVIADVLLGRWAAKGGGVRLLVGFFTAWVVTTIIGAVVYLIAATVFRRRARR